MRPEPHSTPVAPVYGSSPYQKPVTAVTPVHAPLTLLSMSSVSHEFTVPAVVVAPEIIRLQTADRIRRPLFFLIKARTCRCRSFIANLEKGFTFVFLN